MIYKFQTSRSIWKFKPYKSYLRSSKMIVSFPKVSCFSVLNWVWIVRQENQSSLLFLSFFSIFNVFSLSLPPLSFFLKSPCVLPVFSFSFFSSFSLFSLFLPRIRVLFFQKSPLYPFLLLLLKSLSFPFFLFFPL